MTGDECKHTATLCVLTKLWIIHPLTSCCLFVSFLLRICILCTCARCVPIMATNIGLFCWLFIHMSLFYAAFSLLWCFWPQNCDISDFHSLVFLLYLNQCHIRVPCTSQSHPCKLSKSPTRVIEIPKSSGLFMPRGGCVHAERCPQFFYQTLWPLCVCLL